MSKVVELFIYLACGASISPGSKCNQLIDWRKEDV